MELAGRGVCCQQLDGCLRHEGSEATVEDAGFVRRCSGLHQGRAASHDEITSVAAAIDASGLLGPVGTSAEGPANRRRAKPKTRACFPARRSPHSTQLKAGDERACHVQTAVSLSCYAMMPSMARTLGAYKRPDAASGAREREGGKGDTVVSQPAGRPWADRAHSRRLWPVAVARMPSTQRGRESEGRGGGKRQSGLDWTGLDWIGASQLRQPWRHWAGQAGQAGGRPSTQAMQSDCGLLPVDA